MEEDKIVSTETPEKFITDMMDDEKKQALLKKLEVLKGSVDRLEERYSKRTSQIEVQESTQSFQLPACSSDEFKDSLHALQLISNEVRANLSTIFQYQLNFSKIDERQVEEAFDLLDEIHHKYREALKKINL